MDITQTEEAFLSHCVQERRLSADTIAAYRQDVAEFRRFLGRVEAGDVTGCDQVRFADFLSGARALSPATVKRRVACLRSMFGWLSRRDAVPADPFAKVEIRVRTPDRLPRQMCGRAKVDLLEATDQRGLMKSPSSRLRQTHFDKQKHEPPIHRD